MISKEQKAARVVRIINQMINPTTMEVAYRCGLSTKEARQVLRELEGQGQIEARGLKWIVPSRGVAKIPCTPGPVRKDESNAVTVVVSILLGLGLLGVIAVISWVHALVNGGL